MCVGNKVLKVEGCLEKAGLICGRIVDYGFLKRGGFRILDKVGRGFAGLRFFFIVSC